MRILFIAPVPPPVTGHSLASIVLAEHLAARHHVTLINLSKSSFKGGVDSFGRVIQVIKLLKQVYNGQKSADIVYLTISESVAGNIKDILIYMLCYKKINQLYIHLHGGSLKELLFKKHSLLYSINRFFLKKIKAAIILGESHRDIFSNIISLDRIHVIPNFAEDFLFISEEQLICKYRRTTPLNILFLSNMQIEKGYMELLNAIKCLSSEFDVEMHFAGRFDNLYEEEKFLSEIKDLSNVKFHGVVKGEKKKALLHAAHIFCLPTSFLEGQPIAILEAYAAGCLVLTTAKPGITDIFKDGINGYTIHSRSKESVEAAFRKVFSSTESETISLRNLTEASSKYRVQIYQNKITQILEKP